jgi:NADH dehydrogenase [ubiquinone] 1 alpha subcomplex assembly factor 6
MMMSSRVIRRIPSLQKRRFSDVKRSKKKDFEYCVDLVQNRDREGYLCGLLMPHDARRSYFAIRALNIELASIKDGSMSRKVAGEQQQQQFDGAGSSIALKIRFQWWHDALNQIFGESTANSPSKAGIALDMANSCWNNPVVRVLNDAVEESKLTKRFLERLLDAREADIDVQQVESVGDAINYAENTFSSLLYLSLETANVC